MISYCIFAEIVIFIVAFSFFARMLLDKLCILIEYGFNINTYMIKLYQVNNDSNKIIAQEKDRIDGLYNLHNDLRHQIDAIKGVNDAMHDFHILNEKLYEKITILNMQNIK